MTAITGARHRRSAAATIPDDAEVLPEHLTQGRGSRGPRFGDPVWELRPFVHRTSTTSTRCDFTGFTDPAVALAAREYLYSRIRRGGLHDAQRHTPMKITYASEALRDFKDLMSGLQAIGVTRLAEVTEEHLEALLGRWKATEAPHTAYGYVLTVRHLAAHSPFLTGDRLNLTPWPGRTAKALAGLRTVKENTTRRIPEYIIGPLVEAAVFYVETVSQDLRAARRELDTLQRAQADLPDFAGTGGAKERLQAYLQGLREQGRGVPAAPMQAKAGHPRFPSVEGVFQAPNRTLIELQAGVKYASAWYHMPMLRAAGEELGYQEGGLSAPLSPWPRTGAPWRRGLSAYLVRRETQHLRTACWIVIAYLSGMRDTEVRELTRNCAFTEPGDDGRARHKVAGRVFKGRRLSGDDTEWVVLPVVHQAIEVLREINDDPTHLFGHHIDNGYVLLQAVPLALGRFRDHLNDLFSTDDALFIPNEAVTMLAGGEPAGGDHEDEGPEIEHVPWAFNTRQFRRTLAWHIAHQPFGIIAGARQYKHARHTLFEGYAGTSASGFAAEVASQDAVAKLDYAEDLFRDWQDGGFSAGGAAKTIDAEFERIRRELGELPGDVPRGPRLRTMLEHLTTTLHPGILNDCFHNSATAVCEKRARPLGRPLPMLNMCSVCPNSRRTSVHLPRLIVARDQAQLALTQAPVNTPPLQRTALTGYVSSFDDVIAELQPQRTARA